MASTHAILLLKPDAFRKSIADRVLDLVDMYGLEIVCRHRLVGSRQLMTKAFPECSGDHLIEQLLLECQYSDETLEMVLVRGEDAIGAALKLRADVRRRWATGLFANVVHASDEPAEWALQLRALVAGCDTCDAVTVTVQDTYRIRKFPLSLPRGLGREGHLKPYIQTLWNDPASPVWCEGTANPIVVGSPELATHSIVLLENYARFSIDGLTAAVLAAFPHLDLEAAVHVVLAAGHKRRFTIALVSEEEAQRIAVFLRELGLILEVHGPANFSAN